MKNLTFISFIILSLLLSSCEIVQETKFETDGSGVYSIGFDLSEMMKIGPKSQSGKDNVQLDTTIVFSEFIKNKKDSISKLSKEKQNKIKQLENYSLYINTDSVAKKFEMKVSYNFKDVAELKLFGEKLKGQNIKELSLLSNKTKSISKKDGDENRDKEVIPDFNKSYNTTFSRDKFSVKINELGLKEAEKNKDTTLTKDNPMVDLIRFKSKYIFPYRIKKLDNENAKVLSDFKGIEISGNAYEMTNNPKFFDVNVEFDKE